jgi:transcriptional regulator with XRE-family HTH domain
MPNQEVVELRNRILGVLIQNIRERVRASREECASVLGVTEETFKAYEEGKRAVSLPELELLARYMKVPLSIFRATSSLDDVAKDAELPNPTLFLPLRHRIVGARLRQIRMEANRTQGDVASMLERDTAEINDYEYGRVPIPIAELEVISRALNIPIDVFTDKDSEIGQWHELQEQFKQFKELDGEIRDFVLRPINQSYLELAMKLSRMPAGELRAIAEGILEITY